MIYKMYQQPFKKTYMLFTETSEYYIIVFDVHAKSLKGPPSEELLKIEIFC